MNETSLSLLDRLQDSEQPLAWDQLASVYTPLLRTWLRKYHVQQSDADDLIQEVLMAVAKDIQTFQHNGRAGAFRNWLRSILVHRLRDSWKRRNRRPQVVADALVERQLEQLEDPASELSQLWDRQHDRHVTRQLMNLLEPHFSQTTWQAFSRVAIDGVRADEVARELNVSVNAVFIAKSRVLSRLRQEAKGLVASSSDFSRKH